MTNKEKKHKPIDELHKLVEDFMLQLGLSPEQYKRLDMFFGSPIILEDSDRKVFRQLIDAGKNKKIKE